MRFERRGSYGGRRFGGPRRESYGESSLIPVKVGEEYDVEITETGSRGDGIARIKNFVVFVNGAKQGEKPHVKITEVRNRFAIGQKVEGTGATETPTVKAVEETEKETEEKAEEVTEEATEETEEAEEE